MLAHSDADLDPGSMLGPYKIVRPLGVGAMGTVYEAIHMRHDDRVALKVLHADLSASEDVRKRFMREGRNAARVRHPNVAEVRSVGEAYGRHYIVLEYLDGQSLEHHLQDTGRLDVAPALDLVLPICAALAAVHRAGIVHRDIKPSNVFLVRASDGVVEPRLLDFGISKATRSQSAEITATSTTLGTPQYMSPEQTRGARDVDYRTDQYAIGVMLYECVTGQMPIDGTELYAIMVAVHRGEFKPPRAVRPDLPEAFEAVVLRAMARTPDERFPSVRALGHALIPLASPAARAHWAATFDPSQEASVTDPPSPFIDPGETEAADIDLGPNTTLQGIDLEAALSEAPTHRPPALEVPSAVPSLPAALPLPTFASEPPSAVPSGSPAPSALPDTAPAEVPDILHSPVHTVAKPTPGRPLFMFVAFLAAIVTVALVAWAFERAAGR